MAERRWFLKRCNLFERLPPEEINALELRSRARTFPRGSPIYLPADAADGVLVLTEGRVRLGSYTEDGKQTILAFVDPGEMFGELALVDSGAREEFAEAAEKSTVVLIPRDVMQDLLDRYPQLALGVTRLFGLRRQRIERRLKYLLFRSNRERLGHLLLELAEQYGRRIDRGVELAVKLSHQELASIIGSTRETVTVALGELRADGLLELGRQKIILTDPQRLAASLSLPAPGGPGGGSGK